MKLFQEILLDSQVISLYKKLETVGNEYYATHDLSHIMNVVDISERIAQVLNLPKQDIENIKIAALLHDIGLATGEHLNQKENHAERSAVWAESYLEKFELDKSIISDIVESIRFHGKGMDTIHSRILTFADKLDINTARITSSGLKVPGNRQYANLTGVDFEIVDNTLHVNFASNGKLDIDEMNEYYFTPKVLMSIVKLAEKFNLRHKTYIDNNPWELKGNDG